MIDKEVFNNIGTVLLNRNAELESRENKKEKGLQ